MDSLEHSLSQSSEGSTLPPGTWIGPWKIVSPLGRGGMGVVYTAENGSTRAALKLVSREFASAPKFRDRFLRETKLAATVEHGNVVACLGSGEDHGRLWLALELVPGGSLADRVREGPLPWRAVATAGAQIARALEAIHGTGVVHRDLKPANVLIASDGTPKLTDFGLARGEGMIGLTKTGELMGTVEYMSPEQSEGGSAVDARTDLYALGCTLYCLILGRPPFPGSGPSVIASHLRAKPESLRKQVPGTPAELERIVLTLLAKDPRARGGSARQVAEALERVAQSSDGNPGRKRSALAVMGGLALAVAIAAAGVFFVRSRRGPPAKPEPTPSPTPTPTPTPTPSPSPFQDTKPEWFLARLSKGVSVPSQLPKGVYYGKEDGVYWNAKDRSQLVYVPGGTFDLGPFLVNKSGDDLVPDSTPISYPRTMPVTIPPFFIGRFEVSNLQFKNFPSSQALALVTDARVKPDTTDAVDDRSASWMHPHGGASGAFEWSWPVVQITFDEAKAYAAWADLRLPTEEEWELAAGWDGTTKLRRFPWGDESPVSANVEALDVSIGKPHIAPVDSHPEGRTYVGAFNMSGNVKEWVDAKGRREHSHVVKGGGWESGDAMLLRAYRDTDHGRINDVGFRVALSAK